VRTDVDRRGLTLLEVLVAMAILGISAAAWTRLSGQGMHSLGAAQRDEDQMQQLDQALQRTVIASARQLRQRLGTSTLAGVDTEIAEVASGLFVVRVRRAGEANWRLKTAFYRRGRDATESR